MRIHYLQHVPFEGPASIVDWAEERGYALTGSHLYRGDPLPDLDDFDFLVAMGGPMSVNDVGEHAWLVPEMCLIRAAIDADKPVLGVCLGAQLIARAMGATVHPAREKEIGCFPVTRSAGLPPGVFDGLPETFEPLHWHGETLELPLGAVRLAETQACPNQAFQLGRRVIGLQFHLESTPDSIQALTDHCADEIVGGRFQQSVETIRDSDDRVRRVRPLLDDVLVYLSS